jgi:hypothetical protein
MRWRFEVEVKVDPNCLIGQVFHSLLHDVIAIICRVIRISASCISFRPIVSALRLFFGRFAFEIIYINLSIQWHQEHHLLLFQRPQKNLLWLG